MMDTIVHPIPWLFLAGRSRPPAQTLRMVLDGGVGWHGREGQCGNNYTRYINARRGVLTAAAAGLSCAASPEVPCDAVGW